MRLLSSGNERELSLLMLWSLKVAGSPHAIATKAHRPISILRLTAEAEMCWEPDVNLGAPRAHRLLCAVGTAESSEATKDVAIDEATEGAAATTGFDLLITPPAHRPSACPHRGARVWRGKSDCRSVVGRAGGER